MAARRRNFPRESRLAFAGAGRLGSSLAIAASRAGYSVVALSTRRATHREWLREKLPSAITTESPAAAAACADIVFITTSDAAIREVCWEIAWKSGQAAVHCAGVLPVSELEAAARAGAATGGMHPLQTFPRPDAYSRLGGVTFAIESADHSLSDWLRTFAGDLGGVPFDIPSGGRAAYHASAVMASGLLASLAGLSAGMWGQFGVPRDRALASLLPLIESTVAAMRECGLPAAVTGPYVRGDVATVSRHLEAAAQSPDTLRACAALALAGLPLAAEQGRLNDTARRSIETMLRRALREDAGTAPAQAPRI
jgi:predicted short-subunit dehydrogenase-like oxidoreductase (DUF2520 family)